MQIASAVLYAYSWLAFAFVLVILFSIARFYEQKSGQNSHYRMFLLTPVGFVASALARIVLPGRVASDSLLLCTGLALALLSWSLLAKMTRNRH